MSLYDECLDAMYAEAQTAHETDIRTSCYHTLTAHSDGTVSWRKRTTLLECGIAEIYGWQRDYWSLQQFGYPGEEFDGPSWEVYKIQRADAETLAIIEAEIADWGDIAGDHWEHDTDGAATGEPGAWYRCLKEFRDIRDLGGDVDDLFWKAIEVIERIPVGFFADETASKEWNKMAS